MKECPRKLNYVEELDILNVGITGYTIIGSGPLAIRGLRSNNNIDILVNNEVWNFLREKYSPKFELLKTHFGKEATIDIGKVSINYVCEPFKNSSEVIIEGDLIEGHNYIGLVDLVAAKFNAGSAQDKEDLDILKEYLGNATMKEIYGTGNGEIVNLVDLITSKLKINTFQNRRELENIKKYVAHRKI